MDNENFQKLLDKGTETEKEFAEMLYPQMLDVHLAPYTNFEYFDLIGVYASWEIRTFEVKNSENATTSVFVEVSSKGKPSGLFLSKADYQVYKLQDGFYHCKTWRLKKELQNPKITFRDNVWFKGYSAGYVIPIDLFKTIFTKLN